MRLAPPQMFDRRALKPVKGDVVLYEGRRYIIESVGSKYVHMYAEDDERKTIKFAHVRQITKVMPTQEIEEKPPAPPTITN